MLDVGFPWPGAACLSLEQFLLCRAFFSAASSLPPECITVNCFIHPEFVNPDLLDTGRIVGHEVVEVESVASMRYPLSTSPRDCVIAGISVLNARVAPRLGGFHGGAEPESLLGIMECLTGAQQICRKLLKLYA